MKTLLIVGNDSIGGRALRALAGGTEVHLAVDASRSLGRVWRLVRRGSLSIPLVMKMALAEMRRSDAPPSEIADRVHTNSELLALMNRVGAERVVLFRAGLIVTRTVLDVGVPILNIHCARIPEFGGIGSIARALRARAYHQDATLHRVTERIDDGEVLAREPYVLDPEATYRVNEDLAYDAGIRLLRRVLDDSASLPRAPT